MGIRIPTLQRTTSRSAARLRRRHRGTPFRVNVMDIVAPEVAADLGGSTAINPGPYQFHADPACFAGWMRQRGYLFCRRRPSAS